MDNGWSRIQFRMSTKVTGPNAARNSRQYGWSPVHLLGGTLARVTRPNTARNSCQYGRSPVHLLGGTLARVTGPNIARCIALHHISRIVDWSSQTYDLCCLKNEKRDEVVNLMFGLLFNLNCIFDYYPSPLGLLFAGRDNEGWFGIVSDRRIRSCGWILVLCCCYGLEEEEGFQFGLWISSIDQPNFSRLYLYSPFSGSLLSRSATFSAAMATFKDHASSKNSWQATPSKSLPSLTPQVQSTGEASFDDLIDPVELEGLIARIEKPPVQSIPLSSNEAAVHIQKGLFISLQSSTISIEDIITQSNGIISILKSFKVDLSSLYEKVKALVKYSVLWTKVSGTSDKDVSLEELEAQYEVKKTNFEEMGSSYEEMASSVSKLSERVTSLEEEVARTKELLKKLESELSSCKAKHSSSQSDLTKYSETISNSEKDLHVALDVLEQCKKKSAHYDAVKEALDAARASLMN
ncbi:hypothetical protein RHSIM_Rhsim01G0139000 [Rhododendron simsii]|uniref:Uncharacterized protein n=1 Tax=Rhododendron simsii TaxID=118357 RepID=A0A834LZF0_RHOSS|nr:hypothetical protein RHSIM_Rhsim01G0139000 [Rhododendron simsii]